MVATRNFDEPWRPAKHHIKINEELLKIAGGHNRHLILAVPPRHGKSTLASHYFPSWYVGMNPDKKVIFGTYSNGFASEWGTKVRDTLNEYGEAFFDINVPRDGNPGGNWGVRGHLGGMATSGVGGSITGKGANLLILDDVVKNDMEAKSPTYRNKIWEWYLATVYTRLEPGGSIIIIMTRWHEDDLVGRVLEQSKELGEKKWKWTVIDFPAECEKEHDELGRSRGDWLWTERFTPDEYIERKQILGSYFWNSLYQCHPSPEGGAIFKRSHFRYFSFVRNEYGLSVKLVSPDNVEFIAMKNLFVFQTVDPAATEKESSDYFAAGTWAMTPKRDLLLLEMFHERAETTKHMSVMKGLYEKWTPAFQAVENKTFGMNILQQLKKEGYPVRNLNADTDKVSRSRVLQARYEIGAVYHNSQMDNLGDFEDELLHFPNGAHDDMVDTASYAAILVSQMAGHNTPLHYARTKDTSKRPRL